MRVLMISLDKGLLNINPMGDVVERHRSYGERVERCDIIVLNCGTAKSFDISSTVTSHPTNSRNRLSYYGDARRVARQLYEQSHYDLVVCQDPFMTGMIGSALKKRYGSKVLVGFHGDFLNPYYWRGFGFQKLGMRYMLSKSLRAADHFRVVSDGIKQSLVDQKNIPADKISVIPTPVAVENFVADQEVIERITSLVGGKKIILFVGRLVEVKNVPLLLSSFAQLKQQYDEVALVIAGTGELEAQLKNQARNIDDVHFVGQIDHTEKINYCFACDMLVLSSESESFGKVLVEANACEKPVVSTATTGAQSVIEDGVTGYLVPIGDGDALTAKMLYLLNNPEEAQRMGQTGKRLVTEKFGNNHDRIVPMWERVAQG